MSGGTSFHEFQTLLNAACDGALTDVEAGELAERLDAHPELQRLFVDHVQLCTGIRFLSRA